MKAVIFFFVGEQIAIKKGNALSRCPECGDVHYLLGIEVRDKFVSVGSHFLNVGMELGIRFANRVQ